MSDQPWRAKAEALGATFLSPEGARPIRAELGAVQFSESQRAADEFAERFSGEGRRVVDELRQEIAEKPLASRFKPTLHPDAAETNQAAFRKYGGDRGGEIAMKRAELDAEARLIDAELQRLATRIKDLVLNMAVSQTEG